MKRFLLVLAALIVASAAVYGFILQDKKDQEDPFKKPDPIKDEKLEKMIGTWEGKGSQMGMDVSSTAKYSWALGKQFMQVDYCLESKDGKFKYQGLGLFRPTGKGKYSMKWFDDFGYEYSGESKEKDGLLTCEFSCNSKDMKMHFKMETKFDDKGYTETMFMKQGKEWGEMSKLSFTKCKEKKEEK